MPSRKSAASASPPEQAGDALAPYRAKRDFSRTPEPSGMSEAARAGRLYVIQKHAARRLHYDLRLQVNGTLKSWAVTRGPSLEPGERRLAVQVEDHPIDYAAFEGVIPAGQYGGGTVMLWDAGTWEPLEDPGKGLGQGQLRFRLHGRKLKGEWLLVRMGGKRRQRQEPWLLLKHRDQFAGGALPDDDRSVLSGRSMAEIAAAKDRVWQGGGEKEAAPARARPGRSATEPPAFVPPQLATLAREAPAGQDWLHEIKHDGYRCQLRLAGGRVQVLTRGGHDWTARFRDLARAAGGLSASALIDGEAVVLDASGVSSFARLKGALGDGPPAPIHFYAFDLLFLDGEDLRDLPLLQRKQRLEMLLEGHPASPVRYSDHLIGSGPAMAAQACRLGAEGIIAKRVDAPYRSGRTSSWLKVKCVGRQEVVIGGYTPRKGSTGGLGALLTGVWENGQLVFAGKVGTGWDREGAARLLGALEPLRQPAPPFASVPADARRGARWLRPELVAEVRFGDWTPDGRLRHASFQGLREDRDPRSISRERPAAPPSPARPGPLTIARVPISHAERLVVTDPPVSKGDLARYYEAVAPRILPEIAGRPLSLIRCPSSLAAGCFYQRHRTAGMPDSIRPVMAQRGRREPEPYLAVDTLEGLIALVQLGGVELHPWGCRADRVERPDRLVFDLDPAPDLPWPRVIEAAHELRQRLEAMSLRSFPKTTGGKGLHLVVPIDRRHDWPAAKTFAADLARRTAAESPRRYTATLAKSARRGRIFIDYLRNERGSTAVAAYSVRSRPGAPVAMPLSWEEVTESLDPTAFNLRSVPAMIADRGDPWQDIAALRQRLPAGSR